MNYKIIRNHNEVVEKIEDILNKNKLIYSKVGRVKMKNPLTKTEKTLRDLIFFAICEGSENPRCITALKIKNTIYVLYDDINHYNMSSGTNTYRINDETEIIYRSFCNTVKMKHIYDDPEKASKILKGNLLEGNPNDAYRNIDSVDIDKRVEMAKSWDTCDFIKSDATFRLIVERNILSNSKREDKLIELKTTSKQLSENHDLCFACASITETYPLQFHWQIVNKADIKSGKYTVSDYYKTYDYRNVDENVDIGRIEKDVCCIGLGSAGGNIIDQFARLNYFKTYMFIDFDTVAEKNLRNQPYEWSNKGAFKTEALKGFMGYYGIVRPVVSTYNCKYQDVALDMYKFKYLISGFDTLECRLDILNKIKSGEIETQYLIDARYKDLESSLYVVNTSNTDDMEYYEKMLLEDIEQMKLEPPKELNCKWSLDNVDEYAKKHNIYCGCCQKVANEIGLGDRNICRLIDGCDYECGDSECMECIKAALEKQKIENTYAEDNSCLSSNIIHIYKMTSAWVVSAVRSLETDNKKYFTHVDITVDPIPNAIVLKR